MKGRRAFGLMFLMVLCAVDAHAQGPVKIFDWAINHVNPADPATPEIARVPRNDNWSVWNDSRLTDLYFAQSAQGQYVTTLILEGDGPAIHFHRPP